MSEPTYTYLRGTGWIPLTYEIVSRKIGNHLITVEARAPEPGEYYWTTSGDQGPEWALDILEGDYDGMSDGPNHPGVLRVDGYPDDGFWTTYKFVTIIVQRLK